MTTGEKIRRLRIKKGWTQGELARRCGYSGKSVISKTEASGNNIGSRKILKIAEALGVSPVELVDWADNVPSDGNDDVEAIRDFIEKADPDEIHQLRLYADFLMNRGELM